MGVFIQRFLLFATATIMAILHTSIGQFQDPIQFKCRGNETYFLCGTCDPKCTDLPWERPCLMIMNCSSQCGCRQGYYRNATAECVLRADCTKNNGEEVPKSTNRKKLIKRPPPYTVPLSTSTVMPQKSVQPGRVVFPFKFNFNASALRATRAGLRAYFRWFYQMPLVMSLFAGSD